ncbi:hypothetical protein V1523DRAFT_398937 [Lipomyces doorenjongii]
MCVCLSVSYQFLNFSKADIGNLDYFFRERETTKRIFQEDKLFKVSHSPVDQFENITQLGYSSVSGSNAFMGLKQLIVVQILKDENEFLSIHMTHNRPLPHSLAGPDTNLILARLPPKPDVNWHYFILEKFYFDDLFSHWFNASLEPAPSYLNSDDFYQELRYFPVLLLQVMALSVQFLPPDSEIITNIAGGETNLSQRYSDMGLELIDLLGVQGSSSNCGTSKPPQSLLVEEPGPGSRCLEQSRKRNKMCHVIRMFNVMAANVKKSDRRKNLGCIDNKMFVDTLSLFWYNEYKKRVWINLFAWDSLMAMVLGRPHIINLNDCDFQIPINCNISDDPSKTVPMTISPNEDQSRPTTVSASLIRYAIATKVHEARAAKVDRPHPKEYSVVAALHDQALSIVENTTPVLRHQNPDTSWDSKYLYLPQQREEILSIVYTFLTALHRPHITSHAESRSAAIQAAIAVLDSQQRLFAQTSEHYYKLCLLSYYTIDAAISLLAITALYPSRRPEDECEIDRVVKQCIERLTSMAPCNPTAKSGLDVIRHCYRQVQQSRLLASHAADGMVAGTPSPQTELEDTGHGLNRADTDLQESMPFEPYEMRTFGLSVLLSGVYGTVNLPVETTLPLSFRYFARYGTCKSGSAPTASSALLYSRQPDHNP